MNILYGDPNAPEGTPERGGLISMRGADALRAGPGMLRQLSDARDQMKAGLQNDAQRLMFDEQSRRLLTATQEQVGRHLDAQQQAWAEETNKASLDTQARSAGLNYSDDDHLMHTLADSNATGIAGFRAKFGGDGTDPAALQAGQDNQGIIVHSAIEGAAAHGDWTRAQQIFDKFGSVLDPRVSAQIGQELHAKARKMGDDAYLDNLLGANQPGNSGLNGQPRPNTASHQSGDLVVANQPSGQTIPDDTLDRAKQIIDGLEKRGLDPVTAAAFAANAIHESVAKPNNTGDMGNAHGLMMWTDKDVNGQPGRAVKFRQAEGGDPEGAPLDKQLDFIVKELHGDDVRRMGGNPKRAGRSGEDRGGLQVLRAAEGRRPRAGQTQRDRTTACAAARAPRSLAGGVCW